MEIKTNARIAGLVLTTVSAALFSAVSHAGGFAFVTNGNDSGPGSLRDALEVQEATYILIANSLDTINIDSTLEYSSETPVTITGSGQTVSTINNVTLLAVTEGADLTVNNVNFQGPGGFSILNRGDQGTPAGKGIFVDVRDDQTGVVNVILRNVSVAGVANHGIHVSDCSLADDCGGGSGGGGEGSPASISLICSNCTVDDAGNGKFDADGVRIDDRGEGGINFWARNSLFTNVGADGVELDEGNEGSVVATTIGSTFSDNGGYCDPDVLDPFVPEDGEFEEGDEVDESEIVSEYGSPDDTCIELEIETFDSGFVETAEYGIDLDDGIDLDEAGEGDLRSTMFRTIISGNLDEGVDYDEEDAGDIVASYVRTKAFDNTDDGYKMSEEGDGGVFSSVRRAEATDNGGKGFVFEEADAGDLNVRVARTLTSNNDDSDDTGIEAVQEDDGSGDIRVRNSMIMDGIDLDGVDEL